MIADQNCPAHKAGLHYFASIGEETVCIDCGKTMPDAYDYATPEEAERIKEIDRLRDELTAERRRIWDRCRKRMKKDGK